MTFQALSNHIQAEHRKDYANLLLVHADPIIREVGKTTKQKVARQLKMTPQAFTLVYQLILAHVELTEGL